MPGVAAGSQIYLRRFTHCPTHGLRHKVSVIHPVHATAAPLVRSELQFHYGGLTACNSRASIRSGHFLGCRSAKVAECSLQVEF
jgi:hypothetical protein